MKLNGAHKLLVYADVINTLGGSVHTVKKNTEASVVATKQNGLEVNAEETKYMMMCGDQNACQIHNTKTDTSSYEMVEQFKYLETTLMDRNSIGKVHPCTGTEALYRPYGPEGQ